MGTPPAWALAQHVCLRPLCTYCQLMAGTLDAPAVPAPAKLILLKTAEATDASKFYKRLVAMDDESVAALLEVFDIMLVAYTEARDR